MRVHYEEMSCSSAIHRVQGMPFRWSLNPYKGCVHGCQYCYARRYHSFLDLNAGADFSGVVFVKANLPAVLRRELSRPSWGREEVAVGTATDPYQPIEGRYRLTRACLQAFADHANPLSLVTKGTLIVRDVDVLADLAAVPGCTVVFSLTTLDTVLWQQLEPGTPPPHQRLAAMRRLADAGVRAGVLLAPVLPGLTDDPASLERLVRAAADHNAQFLGARTLFLQPGTREHFLGFLRGSYPGLLEEYERLYPGAYTPKRFQESVHRSVVRLKEEAGLCDQPSPPNRALRQLDMSL
jgi:DNA repair photolyase